MSSGDEVVGCLSLSDEASGTGDSDPLERAICDKGGSPLSTGTLDWGDGVRDWSIRATRYGTAWARVARNMAEIRVGTTSGLAGK